MKGYDEPQGLNPIFLGLYVGAEAPTSQESFVSGFSG